MAAICAAPAVCFEPKGFLEGYAATAHPAFVDELGGSLLEKNMYADCRVVVDKQIVTSRGPGTSMEGLCASSSSSTEWTRRRKRRDRWWCSRKREVAKKSGVAPGREPGGGEVEETAMRERRKGAESARDEVVRGLSP